jgi:xylose isomerase
MPQGTGPTRDGSAFEDFDRDKAGERGYGFVRLAVEHLLGAR